MTVYATCEPHPRDTSLWATEFGVERTEAEARLKLAEDVALINPDHVYVLASESEPGRFYLWAHVLPVVTC